MSATGEDETEPDGELVAQAIAGDRQAFAAIYRRYHVRVYRFARAMTGSATLAEDVTQEAFLEFMVGLQRYDAGRGTLSTYLYGIARNVSRHKLRRERRFAGLNLAIATELPAGDDVSRAFAESETVERVRAFVRALPSRYREVLILCDLHGLRYEEAAAVIHTPVGTVRSRLHRARQQLAERLVNADAPRPPLGSRIRKCLI